MEKLPEVEANCETTLAEAMERAKSGFHHARCPDGWADCDAARVIAASVLDTFASPPLAEIMSAVPDLHWRKCRDCSTVALHADSIVPWVLCKKCGSQDTRDMRAETDRLRASVGTTETPVNKPWEILFLDLDGVLCDFISAALAAHGLEYDPNSWPPGVWDVTHVVEKGPLAFWNPIDNRGAGFWQSLKPYPWLDELHRYAEQLADRVLFLSAPQMNSSCYAGKYLWMQAQFGRTKELILTKEKHLLAAPGRLLIDDSDENVERFRAQGGEAILFSQPWNQNHPFAKTPILKLGSDLERLLAKRGDTKGAA